MALSAEFLRAVFDRIYVINLKERTDRRREVGVQLRRVGLSFDDPLVERVEAVRPADAGSFPSIGARGCFMSHLKVLDLAVEAGHDRILILEDDFNWSPLARRLDRADMARLRDTGWHFLHGGLRRNGASRAQALWLRPVAPTEPLLLAHFIGLRGSVIATAQAHLRAMLARPAGSPDGGPMHVDGAYCWLRRLNPEIVADICEPGLAFQRPSRSDIAEAVGIRALPVVSQLLSLLRTTHNSLVH